MKLATAQYVKVFDFEAGRHLSEQEGVGSCIHGHSFQLFLTQESSESDDVTVFQDIERELSALINPMHYAFLNETTGLKSPSDMALLQWIQEHLSDFSWSQLKLLSTQNTGVQLESSGIRYGFHHFTLNSAHFLPNVPLNHKCGRLHGHNFGVVLQWKFEASEKVFNYKTMMARFDPIEAELNQSLLNDIQGLENPTSENLSAWLWNRLQPENPQLHQVTVYETGSSGSTYDGKQWNCFKQFSMDCALQGNKGLMGHTYQIRLHISGDLDPDLGWIVDFGDIKEEFKPYFKQLDHHALHEMKELQSPHLVHIAEWISEQLSPSLPQLSQVELWNTEHSGIRVQS